MKISEDKSYNEQEKYHTLCAAIYLYVLFCAMLPFDGNNLIQHGICKGKQNQWQHQQQRHNDVCLYDGCAFEIV